MQELAGRAPGDERRPLLGLTILVVEDSRLSCEALRLLCQRSGARIRRADSLGAARRHLRVYRPSVLIVDVGLPDGSGLELVREAIAARPRVPVILATSGECGAEAAALAAGADGFLAKPLHSLATFQAAILKHLPERRARLGPRAVRDDAIEPDRAALRDDLLHLAGTLAGANDRRTLEYAARFALGIALTSGDGALADASRALMQRVASREARGFCAERLKEAIVARGLPGHAL